MTVGAVDQQQNPLACFKRSVSEAVVFVCILGFISLVIHETLFDADQLALFLAMYVPVLFTLRCLGYEMGDQLSRAAGWAIAMKMMNVLVT